ncbi:HAMP domain-containing sensor histidine kinase [Nocardioides korecus]
MPADEAGHELLLQELGRVNSELAAQRRLSAMTVHDLANPAQVITGLSELLLDFTGLEPMVRARIEQLHRSAQTMTALIADLSQGYELDDYSRVDLKRIDLVALVTSVVERTRVLAASKDMELVLMVDEPERRGRSGCWVDGDPIKLERALSNLLGNAIKFSPLGSSVSVALDRGLNRATIAVQDSGPGISEEGLDRIFEVYHREPGTGNQPGQGLGLFITRQIAESHGGSVVVESEPGRGATFLLHVPLAVDVALARHA